MRKNPILSRIAAAALSLCCLGSTLVSCSTDDGDVINGNITLASSSAESYAQTLAKKLPELATEVIIGSGDDCAAYGIDMTDFENDGYIIRNMGDSTLLFAKTDTGLTTAVNRFANMYKRGTLKDVAYHEGYRIEKLEIFGTDVSEYVIEYPETYNANMEFAISELIRLVEKATGVTLPAYIGDSGADHVIEFRHSDDEELRDDGYRYYEEDGTLVLEGAYARGCKNAVYRFLQVECGWYELTGGDSFLMESDLISIPAGINKSETPAFDYLLIHAQVWEKFSNERRTPTDAQDGYGTITQGHHGLQTHNYFEMDSAFNQPCFTDEEAYEICFNNVEKFVAANYGSPSFKEVDIAQHDSPNYCYCSTCIKVAKEEGGNSGAVVRFANRLSEEMSVKYPGLVYKIFAYLGTNEPPKVTVPNDMVYVTFCFDLNCANHTLDGTGCTTDTTASGKQNKTYAEWFEGWCDLTDNIYVWFYSLDTNFHDYTVIDTIYDDFTYLHENGVKGIFYQSTHHGLGMRRIQHQLVYNLIWDIDMTEEEYYALYDRLLEKEYGPGWELVREYENIMNRAQDLMDCWHCWGWTKPTQLTDTYYDTLYYAGVFDYLVDIMDLAIEMAETPDHIKRCEMLMISLLYKGCYSEYFTAYENEDNERIAVLSERFNRSMNLMRKYGFNLNGEVGSYTTIDESVCTFRCRSIEEAAWIDWYSKWDVLCLNHQRPEPEEYKNVAR